MLVLFWIVGGDVRVAEPLSSLLDSSWIAGGDMWVGEPVSSLLDSWRGSEGWRAG